MIKSKQWVLIQVDKLVKANWNYKVDDVKKSQKLKENIKRNGQVENVIVRELPDGNFEVVNGNHRLDVFLDIGTEKVICYNMGNVSVAVAQRLAAETNETRFDRDSLKFAELIKGPADEFTLDDLDTTMPFSHSELERMCERANLSQGEAPDDDEPSGDVQTGEIKEPLVCPQCGFVFGER